MRPLFPPQTSQVYLLAQARGVYIPIATYIKHQYNNIIITA